jgi:hypothetical protein
MHELKVVLLDKVKLREDVRVTFDKWRNAVEDGRIPKAAVRASDFRRWSYILDKIQPAASAETDLVDVGTGLGQFASTAAGSQIFGSVRSLDAARHSKLQRCGFEFIEHNIARFTPPTLHGDVVTCVARLEQLQSPGFENAIDNLRAMARERLLLCVPYDEDAPSPQSHRQRFNASRLRRMFPRAEITLLALGKTISWALVDLKVDQGPYWGKRGGAYPED